MILFKIGNTDYTSHINAQDFRVNNNEVFSSWTDINGSEHRDHIRKKISGRFTLGYSSLTDYATAVAALESALATNGYAACQVYAVNDGTTHSINAYLTFEGLGKYDFKNDRQWQTLEVQITER